MKENGRLTNNTVVTTIMSNLGLYKAFDACGIDYEKTTVGDKYVYECMMENGYILGGEQSGHIIFSKNARTGDGVLTSLKLMEVMIESKCSMSDLTRGLKIYPQLLENVKVTDKSVIMNDPDVLAETKKVEEALGDNGRILLRESGTEPVVRVMVEAETDDICKKYVEQVVNVIKTKL
jgi:phosphoglucosamine mutase